MALRLSVPVADLPDGPDVLSEPPPADDGLSLDWREAHRDACGALVDASKRLAGPPFPRGSDGVRALAGLLAAQADDERAEEPSDRAFIESAGALLGLLLVDHAGSGALSRRGDAVRVRVGLRGFVDPFAIIEGALDADRPRQALAAALTLAEAEARGDGPFARVLRAVEGRLAEVRTDLAVRERFEALLVLEDGTELDLRRIVDATRDQRLSAVEAAAQKLVSMIPGGPASADGESDAARWQEARDRVLPRLVPADFTAGPGTPALALAPLALTSGEPSGIAVALVLPYSQRARYVRADEPAAWERSPLEVRERALANLAARSGKARFTRTDTPSGPLVVARTGDGLDAARLLLPGLLEVLAAELGAPCAVAVPHRDTLLACGANDVLAVGALTARARDDAARAPHRISDAVFVLDAGGLLGLR